MSFVKKYDKNAKIYFSSDLHLNHNKDFIYCQRGFPDIQKHNEAIIENIRNTVDLDDEFYILGDLTLGPLEEADDLLRMIPGNVHIILGNHDTDRRIEYYQSLNWDVQFATVIRWNKNRFYLSHYPTNCSNESEDKLSLATINLYGHTHQKEAWIPKLPFSYCVCPEANENRPRSIQDIMAALITCNVFHKS